MVLDKRKMNVRPKPQDTQLAKSFQHRLGLALPIEALYMLRLADSNLILSHRLQELCGKTAPLEEDLALSNLAINFLGHARLFYQHLSESIEQWKSEDDIVMKRSERFFLSLLLCEQPNVDFAYTMVRQFFYDLFYLELMKGLCTSKHLPMQNIAQKIFPEASYHLQHSQHWMNVLLHGSKESLARTKKAIQVLVPYTAEFFLSDEIDLALAEEKIAPPLVEIQKKWEQIALPLCMSVGIDLKQYKHTIIGGKQGKHQEYLGHILAELQYMQKSYPGLSW